MHSPKLRQYSDQWSQAFQWRLNGALRKSLEHIAMIARIPIEPSGCQVVVIATAAQGDSAPTGGFIMQVEQQSGGHTRLSALCKLWNQLAERNMDDVVIAEAECAMVPLTMWEVQAQIGGK